MAPASLVSQIVVRSMAANISYCGGLSGLLGIGGAFFLHHGNEGNEEFWLRRGLGFRGVWRGIGAAGVDGFSGGSAHDSSLKIEIALAEIFAKVDFPTNPKGS
jgi:hypothetical protein